MNVTIYGAGNQRMYIDKLKVPEKYGGEAPYGGAAMAIEFAKAGHDVVLAEEDKKMMSKEMWKKVKDSGVMVVSDYTEAAKNAEIVLFHKSFKSGIEHIAKYIIPNLPGNAIMANARDSPYNISLLSKYTKELKRCDIGVSLMYPIAIPGTPCHNSYLVANLSTTGTRYATEEQIKKCVKLAKSTNKEVHAVPSNIAPLITEMKKYFAIVSFAGIAYSCSNSKLNFPNRHDSLRYLDDNLKDSLMNILKIFKEIVNTCENGENSNPCLILEKMHKLTAKYKFNCQSSFIDEITNEFALILLSGMIKSCDIYNNLNLPNSVKKNDMIYTLEQMEYLIDNHGLKGSLSYIYPEILVESAKYDNVCCNYYFNTTTNNTTTHDDILYLAMDYLNNYDLKTQ